MGDFEEIVRRLKVILGLDTDKEVAEILGMTAKAFASRKLRGAFPEDKLYALAVRRTDLPIPVQYILTGQTEQDRFQEAIGRAPDDPMELTQWALSQAQARITAGENASSTPHLTADELELLELFRAAPLQRKMEAVRVLSGESGGKAAGKRSVKVSGNGNRAAGRDYHEKE